MVGGAKRSEGALAPLGGRDRAGDRGVALIRPRGPHRLRAATCLALLTCAIAAFPASAITGTVVDAGKNAVKGARVCYLSADVELLCVETDEVGFYELPDSGLDRIRLTAAGFLPRVLAAVDHASPIVLERSATLLVRLRDVATGEQIRSGEVFVITPSGRRLGPFPSNLAGVRVRGLEPGSVRIDARAEGYEQRDVRPVDLVEGEEAEVTVEMTPASPERDGTE
jgi:hypothetical protein